MHLVQDCCWHCSMPFNLPDVRGLQYSVRIDLAPRRLRHSGYFRETKWSAEIDRTAVTT